MAASDSDGAANADEVLGILSEAELEAAGDSDDAIDVDALVAEAEGSDDDNSIGAAVRSDAQQ